MFKEGGLEKIQAYTEFVPIPEVEQPLEMDAASGEGEEGHKSPEPAEPVEDPNKDKFCPSCIHIQKSQYMTVSDQIKLLEFASMQLNDHRWGLIIDDGSYETVKGDLFKLYYGLGISYLNVKGIQRMEKLSKVETFAEVAFSLKQREEAQEEE